jgi:hypothetical protein
MRPASSHHHNAHHLRLYGVLDLARAPELYAHVQRLAPHDAECLYRDHGRLHPEIARHCPHVVGLAPHDPLTTLWRNRGWGHAWGLWIESSHRLPVVWRRLRHFTQAILPDGSGPVLFRFWDPRVIRVYLPLVESAELGEWFKDIHAWQVETEDGAGVIRYTLEHGVLSTQVRRLDAMAASR